MNILLVKKYYRPINNKELNKLNLGFEKQIKTTGDQGDKQVETLKDLKPKEQVKPIEGKSNNQSNASYIFNNLINERESTMNKLYE